MSRDYTLIPLPVEVSPKDIRDYKLSDITYMAPNTELPVEYIVPYLPGLYDQGNTGMCMAFTLAELKEHHEWKERGLKVRYSPAFIYVNKAFSSREGMVPRFALMNLKKNGTCQFKDFPSLGKYSIIKEKHELLPDDVKQDAKKQKICSYYRADSNSERQQALYEVGAALICVDIYPSFYKANRNNGLVDHVKDNEEKRGGHAMLLIGWKQIDDKPYWIIQNSWGKEWGDNGYCYVPFNYKGITEVWGISDQTLDNSSILMTIDSQNMVVNNEVIKLDQPAIVDPKTWRALVPVRAPFEALGYQVDYFEETGHILIRGKRGLEDG